MSDLIKKKLYYNSLYDYYKELFTEKQQSVFEMSYYQDWSLGEIAESLGISRTAVHDTLKTVENGLDQFEEKLKMLERFNNLNKILDEFEKDASTDTKELINRLREME